MTQSTFTRQRSAPFSMARLSAALLTMALLLPAVAAHADSPVTQTKALLATFIQVKNALKGHKLGDAALAANKKTYAKLDTFFDFTTLANGAMGRNAKAFKPAQRKDFADVITAILRARGYANGGSMFRKGKRTIGKAKTKAKRTAVPVTLYFAKQDLTMEIGFVWSAHKVVDLIIDGDSLTADFANQVARSLKKRSVAKLLAKLHKKQAKMQAKQ